MTMSRDTLAHLDFTYEVPCESLWLHPGVERNARWRVTFLRGSQFARDVLGPQVVLVCTPCRDVYVEHATAGCCEAVFDIETEVLP
jgi:hypothetical protein